MVAAADGDRAVLEPLFDALWEVSIGYAQRLVGDRAIAEDCVQEGLERLFAQLAHYDPSRDAFAWALTIVTWTCRTARRKRAREAARAEPSLEASADGAGELEARDLTRAALAALASLSVADIETITMMIADDRSHGLSPPTFRKRVERALARLRHAWRTRHGSV